MIRARGGNVTQSLYKITMVMKSMVTQQCKKTGKMTKSVDAAYIIWAPFVFREEGVFIVNLQQCVAMLCPDGHLMSKNTTSKHTVTKS